VDVNVIGIPQTGWFRRARHGEFGAFFFGWATIRASLRWFPTHSTAT